MRTRLKIFSIVFGIGVLGLIARLFFWQIVEAGELSRQGQLQYQRSGVVNATRGSIFATDGGYLTTDENDWTVFATKANFNKDTSIISSQISGILSMKPSEIDEALRRNLPWIPIKHRVSNDLKKNIEALGISGIGFDEELTRVYPEGSSSAHILGFVGKDDGGNDKGYFGLEGFYDLTLTGKPGFIDRESDVNGTPIVFGNSKEIDPAHGIDLVTNIDKTVQMTIEKELANGLSTYGAKGGTVIVMNPATGAIMGMTSSPSFDPNEYWKYSNSDFKDPAISDTFEPGSIFKPIIMASAIDANKVQPDTKCDICSGPFRIDKYDIETWNNEYHPDSSMTDVIVNSDNVGMVFAGQKLGTNQTYDYLAKFGFGKTTGIDLQGEVALALRARGTWSQIDLATTTFGQGIAVTPIQVLRAIGVLANNGVIVKPEIVRQIKNGTWSSDIKPQSGGQVISREAAKKITNMMVQAVERGEAKWAAPQGFLIAGKTGTAQIPISGHYDPTKTIASFVGYVPANNPKFVMLVTLREPTTSVWGSETAAPLWFNIAKDLFPYFRIQPGS